MNDDSEISFLSLLVIVILSSPSWPSSPSTPNTHTRDVYTHRAAPIDLKQFKQTFPLLFEELAYAGTLLEKHWRDGMNTFN